eukprot:m.125879 g.125879  ORF g.125879 m.125879 type:complete len:277 (-) comp15629_c0_seq4:444-1274(-)
MSALEYGALAGTFAAGLLGCLLPYTMHRLDQEARSMFLRRGNSFAAGVLTSAGLVHLLPDASEAITFTTYPFANMLAGMIFIVLLFIELLSHRSNESMEADRSSTEPMKYDNQSPDLERAVPTQDYEVRSRPTIQVYVLAIGLIAHSVIAGLALSLTGKTSTQIGILVAVLAHKTFAAFTLGCGCIRKGWTLREAMFLLLLFCSSTPLGIGIGLGIQTSIEDSNQAVPILQAGAAGVFLYMGFWHLLHEMLDEKSLVDFFIYVAGYGAMSALAVWT